MHQFTKKLQPPALLPGFRPTGRLWPPVVQIPNTPLVHQQRHRTENSKTTKAEMK